jgi:prepilin-type N-terminal cleavage/methylation domain-containing protein
MKPIAAPQREAEPLRLTQPFESSCAAARRRRPAVRQRGAAAFTLIELLVVVAIIALLLTILAPSLDHAKELARRAVCASGLRQAANALLVYAVSLEQRIPPGVRRKPHFGPAKPFESYVAYWTEHHGRNDDGTLIPFSFACLYEAGTMPEARTFYCPAQKTGRRTYEYHPEPWGSDFGTRPDGSKDYYIRTGHLFFPYCNREDHWVDERAERLTETQPGQCLGIDDMLSGESPHGYYWNVARMDGSIISAQGEAYFDGIDMASLPQGWLGQHQAWPEFALVRDRMLGLE